MTRCILVVVLWIAHCTVAMAAPAPRAVFEPVSSPLAPPYAVKKGHIDERPLWSLFHQGRHAELRSIVNTLKRSNPDWRPPTLFLQTASLSHSRVASLPSQALRSARGRPKVRVIEAGSAIAATGAPVSPQLVARWDRIMALATHGRKVDAERLLRETLRLPYPVTHTVITIKRNGAWLGEEGLESLVIEELTAAEGPALIAALTTLLAEERVARLGRALAAKQDQRALQLVPTVAGQVVNRRDGRMATALGWLYLRTASLERARMWFERAVAWSPRSFDAALGLAKTLARQGLWEAASHQVTHLAAGDPRRAEFLGALAVDRAHIAFADKHYVEALEALARAEAEIALPPGARVLKVWTLLNLGRIETAAKLASALPLAERKRSELLRAVAIARATAAADAKQYQTALALLDGAAEFGETTRDMRLLRAWTLYHLGAFADAATHFAAAFDERPDLAAAEGLYLSAGRSGRFDLIDFRAKHPTMQRARSLQRARDFFARGDYAIAAAMAPELYPGLQGFEDPSLAMGLSRRGRSGLPGLGQLQTMRLPLVDAKVHVGPTAEARIAVDRFVLDAGELPPNMVAGTVPLTPTAYFPGWSAAPAEVVQPRLHVEWSGDDTVRAMVGMTPIGGPLPSTAMWDVMYVSSDPLGGSNISVFGLPVSDSRLSLVGLRDPYTGESWGRVLSTGVTLGREHKLSTRDTVSGDATVAYIQGPGVADNDRESLTMRWRRQFALPALETASWGLDGQIESYRRNLSAFTRGHGGYWSPQFHGRMRLALDARTLDLQPFVLVARLGVGPGYAWVDPAPFFPLSPDGRRHEGFDRFAMYYDAELRASTRITDWAHAGASVIIYKNVGYDEQVFSLFLRFLSGKRGSLVADDLDR